MDQGFCPSCGTARSAGRFCASCGADLAVVPPTGPSAQVGMAAGLYELEQLRIKLIVGRLVAIAIGVAIWWVILLPAFHGEFVLTLVSLLVALFGGLWVGTMATLRLVSGRR